MASFENSLKYESEVGGARRPAEPGGANPPGEPQAVVNGSPGRLAPPCVELPVRRKLPHGPPPFSVDGPIVQFVTINAAERGGKPLLPGAAQILDSARFYHENGRWFLNLSVSHRFRP